MLTATLTRDGRITVPDDVRRKYGLRPGDTFVFSDETDGLHIRIAKKRSIFDALEDLPRATGSATIEDMNQGIVDAVLTKHERSRQ